MNSEEKNNMTNGSWGEYRRLVLSELERMNDNLETLNGKVQDVRNDISILKTKASFIGGLSGLATAIIVLIIQHFIK